MPLATDQPAPVYEPSPALSLLARPGDGSIKARRVALLVADGVEPESLKAIYTSLIQEGAVPRFVGVQLGAVEALADTPIHVDITLEASPSVLYDALVIPDGEAGIASLVGVGPALEFVRDQYRHCKPILVLGAGATLLEAAGASPDLPWGEPDPGIIVGTAADAVTTAAMFKAAIAKHRHFQRFMDPPEV
jgi:catalase